MKRLAVMFGILSLAVFTMFIEKDKKKKKSKKERNFLEVETASPDGAQILSSAEGEKYYVKGGKKVYLRKVK